MSLKDHRLPAEWERQRATLLAWPHGHGDWVDNLAAIRAEYQALIEAVLERQPVFLLVAPGDSSAQAQLGEQAGLHLLEIPFDDTWCRDYGPITLVHAGQLLGMDFLFNGWGGKYPAARDNRVNTHLARHALFRGLRFRQSLFELEGGAIDCDGAGQLLVNWHCLRTRHPHLRQVEIERELELLLSIRRVLGIDIEPTPGDDTDGHIDTLARFLPDNRLVFQEQLEPTRTTRLRDQLEALRNLTGQAFELLCLPAPQGAESGLPANYVNFLFVNDACLVPAYGLPADEPARAILAEALPQYAVVSVPAAALIRQYGGIHCASMQIPEALP
ncbi:MAG: agmatine deiminase family protein [Wenzhouxiangella sp.]|nr:agmatine deiminase family protein [Wenzhouxiangella sp.]